jgi:hypothetical protein
MLDWLFPPSCPCDSSSKVWVEERLEWLAEEFRDSTFNGRRIVLPTPEFFPARVLNLRSLNAACRNAADATYWGSL